MTDSLWADVSEFQPVVNDQYPYRWFSFRSNDGTYRDEHFAANLAWAKKAADAGKLDGFIVYAVYEPDNDVWAKTLMSMVGTPHPLMVVMIDVESWDGRIQGDHSAGINAGRVMLSNWLGAGSRVIGYGNASDLENIWPHRGNVRIVLADYTANRPFPGKIAHQFTDHATVAPFGHCDLNSADGYSSAALQAAFGIHRAPTPASDPTPPKPVTPVPKPAPKPLRIIPPFPLRKGQYFGPRLPLWNLKSVSGYFTHNADLKRWQIKAKAKRFYHGDIDGHYGPLTAAAALEIQTHYKLTRDKLIGPATWRATFE